MSEFPGSCPPSDLDRAITAFRRYAFAALLAGEAPQVADVAEAGSREVAGVARAVSWLQAHGQLERDGDLLVGAHGLTRRPTAHELVIGEQRCTRGVRTTRAIPVAFGVTARAATTCPTCGRRLVVDITEGQLPDEVVPVLWMPLCPCENVMENFCVHANLFCGPEHLDAWRHAAGDPPGEVVVLTRVLALARSTWADVADRS
jgi:hypothetical protein